jgi:hypothetical protein
MHMVVLGNGLALYIWKVKLKTALTMSPTAAELAPGNILAVCATSHKDYWNQD